MHRCIYYLPFGAQSSFSFFFFSFTDFQGVNWTLENLRAMLEVVKEWSQLCHDQAEIYQVLRVGEPVWWEVSFTLSGGHVQKCPQTCHSFFHAVSTVLRFCLNLHCDWHNNEVSSNLPSPTLYAAHSIMLGIIEQYSTILSSASYSMKCPKSRHAFSVLKILDKVDDLKWFECNRISKICLTILCYPLLCSI